jgi:peroxiredoxin-like protein
VPCAEIARFEERKVDDGRCTKIPRCCLVEFRKDRTAKSNSAPNAIHFTAPPEFGGLEGRWTPEDLLLGAVASCYTTTFRALAEYSKFEYADLEVEVEGMIKKTNSGYSFTEVVVRPNLTISVEQEQTRALRLLQKAKTLCLVSRALSVEQGFEPRVQVSEARAESSRALPVM